MDLNSCSTEKDYTYFCSNNAYLNLFFFFHIYSPHLGSDVVETWKTRLVPVFVIYIILK